ncbi:MAG: sodium-dependent bicarbonate transport family permease [Pyrinomonadaceae bacterium]|nr:sodium-dependent bicarbonate transport family permease [Pyrinomonadaceae bacterium]
MRLAIPEANPGLYVTMALALTFPFNIIVGLPLYMSVINILWR